MRERRGMQLAVNTLTVLIISIIILGLATTLIYKIYNKAVKIPDKMNQNVEKELFNTLLSSKQKIAVLENVKTVHRGKSAVFSVAFQNNLDGTESKFTIMKAGDSKVSPSVAPDSPNPCNVSTQSLPSTCPFGTALHDPFAVKRYEAKAFFFMVVVPKDATSGEYVFPIDVYNQNSSGEALYARAKAIVKVE